MRKHHLPTVPPFKTKLVCENSMCSEIALSSSHVCLQEPEFYKWPPVTFQCGWSCDWCCITQQKGGYPGTARLITGALEKQSSLRLELSQEIQSRTQGTCCCFMMEVATCVKNCRWPYVAETYGSEWELLSHSHRHWIQPTTWRSMQVDTPPAAEGLALPTPWLQPWDPKQRAQSSLCVLPACRANKWVLF